MATTSTSSPPAARPRRLRSRTDIRAVFAARAGAQTEPVVVRCRARGDAAPARWTVVAGRRVGRAVERNRAKRRLRAVLREAVLPCGVDLVVLARPAAVTAPYTQLRRAVEATVRRAAARAARRTG